MTPPDTVDPPKKAAGIIYGENDRVPVVTLAFLSFQHIFVMSSSLVMPVALMNELGGGFQEVRCVVALSMIACGLGTILQAIRWRGVGSGYLCPNLCGPNFFNACAAAAWSGGLPLMHGMTMFAGVVEVVFARFLHRLRALFPPEITGLVVLMVALGLVPLGVSKFLGVNFAGEPIRPEDVIVASLTLFAMVGVNLWAPGQLRLYGVLIGLIAGYLFSAAAGILGEAQYEAVVAADWLALPYYSGLGTYAFRWSLVPVFVIVSICGALKSFGNLILCEKVNDDEWRAPDVKRIGDGLVADGICVFLSGLLGGLASDTSSSNVALSKATGATSRWIGLVVGGLFIILGFSPRLTAVFSIMPPPVMGAILIFVTCFMLLSGLSIVINAGIDARKTMTVGVAIIFGLSIDMIPAAYGILPHWLRPFFESSLTLATVLAVILNQVLREKKPRS